MAVEAAAVLMVVVLVFNLPTVWRIKTKGPIVGNASLRVALASPGFLAEFGTVMAEIAQFADGMAADQLLENISLIADGHGHVVTSIDEVLAEIRTLGPQGYTLVMGGGCSRTDADLMATFAEGSGGKLS